MISLPPEKKIYRGGKKNIYVRTYVRLRFVYDTYVRTATPSVHNVGFCDISCDISSPKKKIQLEESLRRAKELEEAAQKDKLAKQRQRNQFTDDERLATRFRSFLTQLRKIEFLGHY